MKNKNTKFVKIVGILIAIIVVIIIIFAVIIIYLDNRLEKLSNEPLGNNCLLYNEMLS